MQAARGRAPRRAVARGRRARRGEHGGLRRRARRVGHNTDWSGFARELRRGLPDAPLAASCCSAPAARAPPSRTPLLGLGRRRLTVVDVDPSRAAALAARARATASAPAAPRRAADDARGALARRRRPGPRDADRHGRPPRARRSPPSCCTPDLWVADVVYRPLETELLRAARASAAAARSTAAAWSVFQAAEAFRLFTGVDARRRADAAPLRRRSRAAPTRRSATMRVASPPSRLSGTLEEKLAAAAAAGFDGVEIFENDLVASPLSPGRGPRARSPTSAWRSTSTSRSATSRRCPRPLARNLRRAEAQVRRDGGSSAPTRMLVCSNVSPDADRRRRARRRAAARARRARRRRAGMRIAYEALAWGRHVNDVRPRLADRRARPTTPRSASAWTASTSSPAAPTRPRIRDIPGEKIFFLQLADAPQLRMDVLQWSRHYRCFPGQGGFDLAGFVARRARRRLRRAAVAGGLQRRLPPGRPGAHGASTPCARCSSLEEALGRRAPRARRLPPRASTATPSSSSPSTRLRAAETERCSRALGFAHRRSTAPSRCSCGSRATARVLLNAAGERDRHAAASPRSPWRAPTPARRPRRAEALLAPDPRRAPRRRARPTSPPIAAPDGTRSSSAAPTPATRELAGATSRRAGPARRRRAAHAASTTSR